MASNEDKSDDKEGGLLNQVPGYTPFDQQAQTAVNNTGEPEPQWPQWPQTNGVGPNTTGAGGSVAPGGEVLEWQGTPHEWLGGQTNAAPSWPGAERYGLPTPEQLQSNPPGGHTSQGQAQSQAPQGQAQAPQGLSSPPPQMTQQQYEQFQQLQQNYQQQLQVQQQSAQIQQYQQQLQQQFQNQSGSTEPTWPGQIQNQPGGQISGPGQAGQPQGPGQPQGQGQPQFPGLEGPEFIPSTPKYMNPPAYPDLPWKAGPGPTWAIFADHEHHRMPPAPPQPKPALPPGGSANNPLPVLPLPIGSPEPPEEEDLEGLAGPAARLAKLAGKAAANLTSQNNPVVTGNNGVGQQKRNTGKQGQDRNQGPNQEQNKDARGFRRPLGPGAFPGQEGSEEEMATSFISKRPFLSSGGRGKSALGFSKSDIFGLATYNFMVTKDILFDPRIFFNELSLSGGFGEPILYSFFACLLSSALYAIAKLNIFVFFWAFIVSFLSVILGAVVVTWAFRKMGGKGNLEGTFRVLAFSKATVIFSWISLGAVPLGMLLAAAYTGYMNYVGLTRVHHLPRQKTIILVVVLSILGMLWRQGMP